MPKIPTTLEFHAKPKEHLWDMMRKLWEQLALLVNGNISLGTLLNLSATGTADPTKVDNIKGALISVNTPGVAGTNFIVNHNLGYIPSGWIPVFKSAPVDIYQGTTATTTSQMSFRATATTNVVLFIF